MPKYPTSPACFDKCRQVTITGLERSGFLRPNVIVRRSYSWTRVGKRSGSITITASLTDQYVELDYLTHGKPINYRVNLERIPAHFGGYNWYFLCPATGKRCRTLYGIGKYFLSRFAYPSAMYSCQTQSKGWRDFGRVMGTVERNNMFNRPYSRTHYKGKPTKRYRRWIATNGRRETAIDEQGFIAKFLAF